MTFARPLPALDAPPLPLREESMKNMHRHEEKDSEVMSAFFLFFVLFCLTIIAHIEQEKNDAQDEIAVTLLLLPPNPFLHTKSQSHPAKITISHSSIHKKQQ